MLLVLVLFIKVEECVEVIICNIPIGHDLSKDIPKNTNEVAHCANNDYNSTDTKAVTQEDLLQNVVAISAVIIFQVRISQYLFQSPLIDLVN